ncbi:tRNA (guanosine(46)-N7)-methyltransferase TrmB [Nosocomiicoccus ampullae]|uniref:tRNA (guanine-N(7)-)-methyltransferase n=1 Tax=Nosocomiicoccus ampullae TaxID=489910 RepID=A0A9Q2CXJ5_9STAP|nr:tRNA (guanosine(46)-N7)-methyltransferase TrmB [Nosocomiicoccus ampullae]MBB5175235.1 tRNA (guanine-N7-)-methyltransferase [Nosocomiicoccus ampullae]QYA46389.1 tRNA (guanosine(46)-N7)-methyltransferase TrmB [Nosocomiicoccus ampullae]QYA47897.1 tRNA (guanosine(46)-N7)-methyltransferase TrmB [Nosocomiicoccus ampullae]
MRMRNKPWAMDFLKENNHIVDVDGSYKNNIKEFFNNDNDIHIEVGTGMGQFITTLAKENPDINFVGIEIEKNVLIRVLEKVLEEGLTNVRLLLYDANLLDEYFNEDEVSKIYLNFSDPWPKNRHEKRRLTYESFLSQYKKILNDNGTLQFKTDNRGLFEYSLISLNQFGTEFLEVNLDLHDEEDEDNIRTEYEEKFSSKGFKIYKIVIQF